MNKFSDFGITIEAKSFTGDKIKIERIINREITVIDFKIEDSKFKEKGNGKYMNVQIKLKDEMHVLFTGSIALMEQLQKVPKQSFPFTATIAKQNERLIFT